MEKNQPTFDAERKLMLRKVFNVVSHDLKTPLALIIGSLETIEHLENIISEEDKKSLIKTAISEARNLDKFITKMLATNDLMEEQDKKTT